MCGARLNHRYDLLASDSLENLSGQLGFPRLDESDVVPCFRLVMLFKKGGRSGMFLWVTKSRLRTAMITLFFSVCFLLYLAD